MKGDLCLIQLELAVCEEELLYLGSKPSKGDGFSINAKRETVQIRDEIEECARRNGIVSHFTVTLETEELGWRRWIIEYQDNRFTIQTKIFYLYYYPCYSAYMIGGSQQRHYTCFDAASAIVVPDEPP
jgi:hypothetical protein